MKKFSLELVANGELVENSAQYFETVQDMHRAAAESYLEEGERLYVTVLNGDTWEHDEWLTTTMNLANLICAAQ